MSARILAIRADSSSSRASSLPVNSRFAGSGALHDSQAAIRRLKTAKPQAGHLNRDESVIEVGLQAAQRDVSHLAVPYLIADISDRPHLADAHPPTSAVNNRIVETRMTVFCGQGAGVCQSSLLQTGRPRRIAPGRNKPVA